MNLLDDSVQLDYPLLHQSNDPETSLNFLQDPTLPSLFDEHGSLFLDNDFNDTTISSDSQRSPIPQVQQRNSILPPNLLRSPLNSSTNDRRFDARNAEESEDPIDVLALSTTSYIDNRDTPHKLHATRNRLVSIQAEHDSPPPRTPGSNQRSPTRTRFGGFASGGISEESGGSSEEGKTGDVEGFLRDWQGDELRTREIFHEVPPLALNGISLSPTVELLADISPLVPSRPLPVPLSIDTSLPTPLGCPLPFPPSPPPSTHFPLGNPSSSTASTSKLADLRAFASYRLQGVNQESSAKGGMEDEDFKVSPKKKNAYAGLGVRDTGIEREIEEVRISSVETIKATKDDEPIFQEFNHSSPPSSITPLPVTNPVELSSDTVQTKVVEEDLMQMWDDSTEFKSETQSALIAPLLPRSATITPSLPSTTASTTLKSSGNTNTLSASDRLRRKIEVMSLGRSGGATATIVPADVVDFAGGGGGKATDNQPKQLFFEEPEIPIVAERPPELEVDAGDLSVIFGGRQVEGEVEQDNFITPAPFGKRPLISAALASLLLPPTLPRPVACEPLPTIPATASKSATQNSFLSPLVGRHTSSTYEAIGSERKETTRDRLDRAREERIRRDAVRSPENIAMHSSLRVDAASLHSVGRSTARSPVASRAGLKEVASPSIEMKRSGSMRSSLAPGLSRSGPRGSIIPVPATTTTNPKGLVGSRLNRSSLAGSTSPTARRLSPTANRISTISSLPPPTTLSLSGSSALAKSAIPSIPRRSIAPPLPSTRLTASALSSNFPATSAGSFLLPASSRPLAKRTQSASTSQRPASFTTERTSTQGEVGGHTRTSSASSLMSSDRENYAIPRLTTSSTSRGAGGGGGGGISASSSSSTIVGIANGREREIVPSRTNRGIVRPISKSTTGSIVRNPLASGAGSAAIRPDPTNPTKLSQSSPSTARLYSIAPPSSYIPTAIPSPSKLTLVSSSKRMSLSTNNNPGGRLPLRTIELPSSSSASGISALAGGIGRKVLGESGVGGGGEGKMITSRSGAPLGVKRGLTRG